jgi:hypothetical protein
MQFVALLNKRVVFILYSIPDLYITRKLVLFYLSEFEDLYIGSIPGVLHCRKVTRAKSSDYKTVERLPGQNPRITTR